MSVSDLNHFMTYVIEGWMLFSAGFISVAFVSFVSQRIQEDLEAAALAQTEGISVAETEAVTVAKPVAKAVSTSVAEPLKGNGTEEVDDSAAEEARLEEVAAVSEELAKAKEKQANSPSVSVSL